ncbi:hypothetical protein ACFW04_011799 [Cataglyphis niger]
MRRGRFRKIARFKISFLHQKERRRITEKLDWLIEKTRSFLTQVSSVRYFYLVASTENNDSSIVATIGRHKKSPPCVPIDSVYLISRQKKRSLVFDLIKHMERNIRDLYPDVAANIRNAGIIGKFLSSPSNPFEIDRCIGKMSRITSSFLKHPDLLITRSDKGNTTVALDKSEYIHKMELLLNDKNTYSIVNRDSVRRITNDLPLFIAAFLHNIIFESIPKSNSHVSNSYDLVNKLNSKTEKHYQLASLDIISLFTNVPNELAIKGIGRRMQTFGSPMGFPLSPVLVDIVLQRFRGEGHPYAPHKMFHPLM